MRWMQTLVPNSFLQFRHVNQEFLLQIYILEAVLHTVYVIADQPIQQQLSFISATISCDPLSCTFFKNDFYSHQQILKSTHYINDTII